MSWSKEPIKRKSETELEFNVRLARYYGEQLNPAIESLKEKDDCQMALGILIEERGKFFRKAEEMQKSIELGCTRWSEHLERLK